MDIIWFSKYDWILFLIACIVIGIAIACGKGHGRNVAKIKFILWIASCILCLIAIFIFKNC